MGLEEMSQTSIITVCGGTVVSYCMPLESASRPPLFRNRSGAKIQFHGWNVCHFNNRKFKAISLVDLRVVP
ncbi:MAG: hypothetical protein CL925_13065 [Deltaproteobacteria bacterium]|nr:hypothetical protein [Deltaproteobacteria bacterium]